jgi:hypothetical protein
MMLKWKLRIVLAAAAIMTLADREAAATPILTTVEAIGSIGFGAKAGSTVIDFDSGLTADPVFSASGSLYGLYSGTMPKVAASPFGDATQYYSTGMGTTTITFDEESTYLGLLWGSVDAYNSIAFYKDGNLIGTVNGAEIRNPANGDQGIGGTYYVNFEVEGGYDSVKLISTSYSFEIDDLAYGAAYRITQIPEPFSVLVLGAGLLALGISLRRPGIPTMSGDKKHEQQSTESAPPDPIGELASLREKLERLRPELERMPGQIDPGLLRQQ